VKNSIVTIIFLSFCFWVNQANANKFELQDLTIIEKTAEDFLQRQINQFKGKSIINIGKVDNRLQLQKCEKLQAFLPNGSKVWGKTTVGMRCNGNKPWVVFLNAEVKVFGDYYLTRTGLTQGQIISEQDLLKANGEISSMPASTVTNLETALGKIMLTSLIAGVPLRQEMFKDTPVVQQGQIVKITVFGNGFNVTNEATAINNASEGQIAKAKTSDGQLIAGIARTGGVIEIKN
jgi:flagella basal body P-ring formation protein FlgA